MCRAAQALLDGDAEAAIGLYTDLLNTGCGAPSVLVNRSAAYSRAGRHSLAVADLRQVTLCRQLLISLTSHSCRAVILDIYGRYQQCRSLQRPPPPWQYSMSPPLKSPNAYFLTRR